MLTLTPVQFDDPAALNSITARKQLVRRGRLTAATASLLGRYTEYHSNTAELSALAPSTIEGVLRDDCHSLYEQPTDELLALKGLITAAQQPMARLFCQYCAIGEPNTYDHYVPKGSFPEFSIFSLNLIPCCYPCNQIKDEGWTQKGYRHFVNLYHDTFVQSQMLAAELVIEPSGEIGIRFSLTRPASVTPHQLSIYSSHLQELGLYARYAQRAAGLITEVCSSITRVNERIGITRSQLDAEAGSLSDLHGLNNWRAVVYRCLAESHRFLDECFGNSWLQRARAEVDHLLSLAVSPATTQQLRDLVQTRAWRMYAQRGFDDGHADGDWFAARAELRLPDARWV